MTYAQTNRPILFVEDNPMDVDLTLRAFNSSGLANPIHVCRDGEEALAYLTGCKEGESLPVVVLLDLKLPKVDGLEVLRHIRRQPQFQTVPVVILTTSADDRDVQAAYRFGANSYIVKPVDFQKFMEVAKQIHLYWVVTNVS